MMVNPIAMATSSLLATSSVAPVPTVIPGSEPIYSEASATGQRTLWVVCVIMGISSLIFYGMAFRVPVVSQASFPLYYNRH